MSTEFFNDQWRIPSNENQNKVSNYSMNFDGSSTKVDLGSTIGNIGVSSTTISFWLNIPTTTSNQTVLSNRGSGGGWAIDMFDNAGQYTISFFNASSSTSIRCGFSDFNTWAHIVFVRDGIANNKIYINGVSQTLTSNNENLTNIISSKTLTIGAQDPLSNGYYRFLNGKIDQLTFFDYALSQDQVTQLGAEGYAFNFIPNDYIDLGTTTAYDTGDLSAAIWVKITDNGTTQYIFSNSGSPSIRGFDIKVRGNNEIGIQRYNTTNGADSGWISPGFVYDTWQHLAFTYEESTGTIKTFLNGNLVATDTGTSTATLVSEKLTIGSYKGVQSYANGELSNAVVFNSKLEDSEIATIYNNGKPLADMSGFTSLQGWWKLDDNEIFNTTSAEWSVDNNKYPSAYQSSLNFNNDYIRINSFVFGGLTSLSISCWYNLSTISTDQAVIARWTSLPRSILLYHDAPSGWRFLINGIESFQSTHVATANTWQHLVVVYESGAATKIYLNGVSQVKSTTSSGAIPSSTAWDIGRDGGTTTKNLNGELSNLAIWDTALTDPQVQTIYNNGTPEASISHSPTSWYKLDNTTTGIQDSVGSNNGTNNGAIEYPGFVNTLAGESVGMNSSNLVASNINGELIANPMITSPKPIAYYQLGDQSINNGANYLVPNNSLSEYVFNFINPSDGINVPLSNVFNFGTGDFTISMWFKINSFPSFPYLFDFRPTSSSSTDAPGVYISSSNRAYLFGGGTIIPGSAGKILATDIWYNFVVKRTGNTFTIHYDGGSADRTGTSTVNFNTDLEVHIGSKYDNLNGFDGEISNFQVFNSALPQTGNNSIETIYNNGSPLTSMSGFTSLVAWYKLDSSEIFNSTSTEWSVDNNAYPSVYNSSLDFIPNDYINAGTGLGNSLGTYTGDASVSLWFKADTTTSNDGLFSITAFDDVVFGNLRINIANNNLLFVSNGIANYKYIPFADTTSWHHLVCVFKSGDITNSKIYLDGIDQTTTDVGTFPSSLSMTGLKTIIGAYHAPANTFDGKMSNVSFFNTALSTPNVQTLYNNGAPALDISSLNPVSWWKLDNTTTGIQDSAGSNNGTNNGATEYAGFVNGLAGESSGMDSSNLVVSDLQQTSGYSPYALSLDGVDDYLDCGDSDTFSFGNGTTDSPFSLSAWVKPDSTTKFKLFGKFDSSNTNYEYQFGTSNSKNLVLSLYNQNTADRIQRYYNNPLTSLDWQHWVATYDGSGNPDNIKIYINGVQVGDTSVTVGTYTAMQNTAAPLLIASESVNYANGTFSNVSVFNIELSSTQVTEVYNQGVPSNLNTFSGTAPVAWWQLGSNSSFNTNWTCLDEIGTNNAVSAGGMTNNDIVDGPGYSAMGLGTSSIDIKGDAPYSTANGLSENMDVLDRVTDVAPS